MDQVWRLNNNNNSYVEEEDPHNSNVGSYGSLRQTESLDVSLFDSPETEDGRSEIRSTDSAYGTSEELPARECTFDIQVDSSPWPNLDNSFDQETFNLCLNELSPTVVKLPMDFNELLTSSVDSKALTPTHSDVAVTPTSKQYVKLKQSKRPRSDNNAEIEKNPKVRNVTPSNPEDIKSALLRSVTDANLIGDFSKSHYLPLISGQHPDLKTISVTTMSQLLKGDFSHDLTFTIIDCRYPYEFTGGHISGAINLYTQTMIIENLLNKTVIDKDKRYVLIFHCEFSSSRAPSMCRFLRNFDRKLNEESYPNLSYPEMYLLEGGYKNFYTNCSKLCVPEAYVPMDHPEHIQALSYFREQTKIKFQPKI
ncbi:hypothetical protein PPYR_04392 [Photinus pyralis]|uniref:protein-tyrosine-phosphatase n=1 Tax=Photinus pyralis TaxID=7054 RepID=A0A5N4AY10_PHOPY|nr:M-phase inducer phosphatase-like [Photinus pyralis]KAB0802206.1 hypothetical protein PPYR_04392 [Photinus pyralis]